MATNLPALKELESGGEVAPIVPRTVNEVGQVVDQIVSAGMVPSGLVGRTDKETRAKLVIAVMKGLEVGFAPLTAVANIMVVNNRASVWGDALPALAQRSGEFAGMKEHYEGEPLSDARTAVCELYRKGIEQPCIRRFSLADAKRAKLYPSKGPWLQYPDRMLQMRARSWAFRDLFADCLMGLSVAEEAQDLPMKDVTPNVGDLLDDEPPVTDASEESEVMPDNLGPEETRNGTAERGPASEPNNAEPPSQPIEAGASRAIPVPRDMGGTDWFAWLDAWNDAIQQCETVGDLAILWGDNAANLKLCKQEQPEAYAGIERVKNSRKAALENPVSA